MERLIIQHNQSPTNTYSAAGNYMAVLTATSSNGCVNTASVNVKVNALPTATFTAANACLNNNVVLNNTSNVPSPDFLNNYSWNFGSGASPATSSVVNPTSLVYATSGIKTITLNITANTTCTASITNTVEIYAQPVANFSTTSVCQSTATAFTDLSTPTGSITAWSWDFTNDGVVDNSTNAPTNVYTTSGTFTASLIVTDSHTCKDTVRLSVDVWGHAIPDFSVSPVCFGTASVFHNLTNETANANVGSPTGWLWDFADGAPTSTTQNPTHTYTNVGVTAYTPTLTATTFHGCIDSKTYTVTVHTIPTATFTAANACLNSNVVLNNTSSVPSPDFLNNYSWNFGSGASPATSSVVNPTPLVYTTSGIKTITLNITANTTCTASITNTVEIYAQPVANFSTTSVCQSTATAFTDLSTPTGSITAWSWDFTNDGIVDNSTNAPTNVYTSSGTFTASLIVTDSHTCKDTVSLSVDVWGHAIPDFSVSPVCFGTASVFHNLTNETANANVGSPTGWLWDFADGAPTSTAQNPTHMYTNVGVTAYTPTLTATTFHGCIDRKTYTVTVHTIPTATFTAANACLNNNVVLNNTSNVPSPDFLNNYSWNFGSGASPATSSVVNPTPLVYTTSGIKTITLNITANTTCTASITNTVEIYAQPVANFSTTSVCQSTATVFTDLSTPTGSITAWSWDFTNDGVVDNSTNAPTNVYTTSGTFTASLIVTDSHTCKDTVSLSVDVWGHAIPDFSVSPVCFGTASSFINLTNTSANTNTGASASYNWNFNDLTTNVTTINPLHTYALGGNVNATYNVTLTVKSFYSCFDSIVKPVKVFAVPTASFTSDSVCLGMASHLIDASNGNGNVVNSYSWDYLSDGTVDVTGVSNPSFIFPAFGINHVTYTVSSTPAVGLVCSNTTNSIVVWVNPNPVPDFTFVNKCINAQPNSFDASTSTIAVGTNTNYAWAFGDGGTSILNPTSVSTHSYSAAGIYNVTLTVTSNKGCQTIGTAKQVEVYKKPSMLIANSTACDRQAMTFTAVAQPNGGVVGQWYWDFNNVISTIEANGQTAGFTFTGPGTHTVSLVSETTIGGCRDTIKKSIYVNYVPAPLFKVDKPSGCPEHCVVFTDLTLPVTAPSQIVNWEWTLGDGKVVSNSTGAAVSHCYDNSSSSQLALYDVKLVVTTDSGCTNVNNKLSFITVYPKPIANYTVNPNPGNVVEPLEYFTNESQDFTKWWWSFGDGPFNSDSTNLNPTHLYSDVTANTYYSHLIVMNQYRCRDTAYVPVVIGPEFTFYIPNAFTPSNGDGINDLFSGKGIGIEKYEMWIFDRWGAMIFYTDDIVKGWNGTVQGKTNEVQQDVYIWKVKLRDVLGKKHEYIGHVTLLK